MVIDKRGEKIPLYGYFTVFAALVTMILVLAQFLRFPSDLKDAVNNGFPDRIRLAYPLVYTIFSPFFQLADHFTILSIRQHYSLLIWLNASWLFLRVWRTRNLPRNAWFFVKALLSLVLFDLSLGLFIALVVLVPRPMAAIRLDNPDLLAIDFHSHTKYSWDARKSFSPYNNLLWHAKSGFNASFVTDHNVTAGSKEAGRLFSLRETPPGIVPLHGEEISLYKAHWVLLGNETDFPSAPYNTDYKGIELFIKKVRSDGQYVLIASLPEYWLYHWDTGLNDFPDWGIYGFEIVNSAPIALDFPPALRKRVVELCREKNLIVTGITDNHGWGSTVYVWNVMKIHGWQALGADSLEQAVLSTLKKDRFQAARVLTRVKAEPKDNRLWLIVDPFRQIWTGARALPPQQAVACIIWLWGTWFILGKIYKKEV